MAIDELIPNPKNSNTHSQQQIDLLAKIIKHQGWRNPIVVSKRSGFITKGHARLAAAKVNEFKTVPVDYQPYASEALEWADMIADNKIAELAEINIEMLNDLAKQLPDDFDFDLWGIPDFEIDYTKDFEDEDIDKEIEPVKNPKTKPGQLFELGNHRLLCGDAENQKNVELLLGKFDVNLLITDPPYGVNYDPEWREGADLGIGKRSKGKVVNDDQIVWKDAFLLAKCDVAYIWHASQFSHLVAKTLIESEYEIKSQIIWVKQHFALSRGDYHWQHEPCWYVVKKGKKHNWQGKRDQSTTWDVANNNAFGGLGENKSGHGTQKPVELYKIPISNNSKQGDFIYDAFAGSGSVCIACEELNRKALMMEIDPGYCDAIIQRWEELTGKKSKLIK